MTTFSTYGRLQDVDWHPRQDYTFASVGDCAVPKAKRCGIASEGNLLRGTSRTPDRGTYAKLEGWRRNAVGLCNILAELGGSVTVG